MRLALLASSVTSGCAVHYFDAATNTQHVFGFGHMALRVQPPNEGVRAVATQIDLTGVTVECGREATGLALGWHRLNRVEVRDDTTVRFDWPSYSLFDVRVGSALPAHLAAGAAATAPPPTPQDSKP